jgi:hypothetical protein
MAEYRFILEPYTGLKSRYTCPKCKKNKCFSRYIDKQTLEYIASNVGRCNRESSCGYHYTPKQYFAENKYLESSVNSKLQLQKPKAKGQVKSVSVIQYEVFLKSQCCYDKNNFIKFLTSQFGKDVTTGLINRYYIATSKYWLGATVFWQVDTQGNIRGGKIMLYEANTGTRVKKPHSHITWVHKALKIENFDLQQCFFGEHLLKKELTKPIAIVESEKTAIIASVYLPKFVWLATGGLSNLTPEKCKVLEGRNVALYPDLNAFDKWSIRAKELSHITTFKVSDLLERNASKEEREQGLDLADYLITKA